MGYRRSPSSIGAAVVAALLVASMAPAMAATSQAAYRVRGTVACRTGQAVVGVWVASDAGASNWANWSSRQTAAWVADYSILLPARSTNVVLHVGCGGSQTDWWSTNLTREYPVSSNKTINVVCDARKGESKRCANWGTQALVGMPFRGDWNRFGDTHPSVHHSSGDWSTDLYDAPPEAVRAHAYAPKNKRLTMKIGEISSTCGRGENVRVDVYLRGKKVGWFKYGHLKNIPQAIRDAYRDGTKIAINEKLGEVSNWRWKTDCWEVRTKDGIHTHVTLKNTFTNTAGKKRYACYRNYKTDKRLDRGRWIGSLGGTGKGALRKQCTLYW